MKEEQHNGLIFVSFDGKKFFTKEMCEQYEQDQRNWLAEVKEGIIKQIDCFSQKICKLKATNEPDKYESFAYIYERMMNFKGVCENIMRKQTRFDLKYNWNAFKEYGEFKDRFEDKLMELKELRIKKRQCRDQLKLIKTCTTKEEFYEKLKSLPTYEDELPETPVTII